MVVVSGTLAASAAALYPRCDLWLTLAMTQLVYICSLHASSSTNVYYSAAPQRSAVEVTALTLSSLSFALSFLVGVGYFHRPFREYLTNTSAHNCGSSFKKLRECATVEQFLSLFLLVLVSIQSGLVLWPSSSNVSYLAVAGSEIWNTTLFYATWISLYGAAYLTASVTSMNSNGKENDVHSMRLWFMVLFSSICASVTLLILHSGPTCQVMVLAETTYCSSSLTAGLLWVGSALLSFLYRSYLLHSTKRNRGWSSSITEWIGLLCASLLLGIHSIIIALVSSPSGPGNEVGSVFLVSWLTWIFGVLLCKSCIESFFVSPALTIANLKSPEKRHKRRLNDDSIRTGATITDDESKTEKNVLDVMEEDSDDSNSGGDDVHCPEWLSESREDEDRKGQRRHPLDSEGSNVTNHYYPRENAGIYRRGGSMLTVTGRGGTLHHQSRNDMAEPPAVNGRPILRGPSSHQNFPGRPMMGEPLPRNIQGLSPVSNNSPAVAMNLKASQFTYASMNVDKEWDFSIPAPQMQPVAKKHTHTPALATPMATITVPTASVEKQLAEQSGDSLSDPRTAEPTPKLDGFMTSKKKVTGKQITPSTDSSGSAPPSSSELDIFLSDSHSVTTVLTQEGFDLSEYATAIIAAVKYATAATKVDTKDAADNYCSYKPRSLRRQSSSSQPQYQPQSLPKRMPLHNGSDASSLTAEPTPKLDEFMTSKKKVTRKQITPSTDSSGSAPSSSSEFDTVVSASHSVNTVLTQEGFDLSESTPAIIAAVKYTTAATKVDTKDAADNYSSYMPSSPIRQSSSSQPQYQPQSLPKRMPLYNGSDASSLSKHMKSPSNSDSQQELRRQEINPSVEAFLASANENARLSRIKGNMEDMRPTTDEESLVNRHQQHMLCRKSGVVNVSSSSSGRAHAPSSLATATARRESMQSYCCEDNKTYSTPGGEYFC